MVALRPITSHLVADAHAARVVAPAYDALTPRGRLELRRAQPDTYLSVLPTGSDDEPASARRRTLDRLLATGRFSAPIGPALFVLELTDHDRCLTAVVGDVDVGQYLDGTIRPHEHVRAARVAELASELEAVGASSSPVCVLHRHAPRLEAATARATDAAPTLDVALTDGAHLRVWVVEDTEVATALTSAAGTVTDPTIADGHHRAAAVAQRAAVTGGRTTDDVNRRQVLTALVSADHLGVEPFHRRIEGLAEVTVEETRAVLARGGLRFLDLPGPSAPSAPGRVHLVVEGRWFAVDLRIPASRDPATTLDAAVADEQVVGPLGTLADGPQGAEVVAVPGPLGLDALQASGSVGVALHPPSLEDLLAITGAGGVLPHKSTYLLPKLRSGVLVVPR